MKESNLLPNYSGIRAKERGAEDFGLEITDKKNKIAKKLKKVDKNELEQLQSIKINKQNLLIELGEIKLLEIQLAERLDRAKENKLRIENFESFNTSFSITYKTTYGFSFCFYFV